MTALKRYRLCSLMSCKTFRISKYLVTMTALITLSYVGPLFWVESLFLSYRHVAMSIGTALCFFVNFNDGNNS